MSSDCIKIRIPYQGEYAIGPGKADLLDAIIRTGSISAAAKSMGMSYKRAWDLVNTMNVSFLEPLVATTTGGSHGGGAHVTDFGQAVLTRYRDIQIKAAAAVETDIAALKALLK